MNKYEGRNGPYLSVSRTEYGYAFATFFPEAGLFHHSYEYKNLATQLMHCNVVWNIQGHVSVRPQLQPLQM